MRDLTAVRCARTIAGHLDHLFIAALICGKLAGVELTLGRDEKPGTASADARADPGAERFHFTGARVEQSYDGNSCSRAPRPSPETRRERERRARMRLFGTTIEGRVGRAG